MVATSTKSIGHDLFRTLCSPQDMQPSMSSAGINPEGNNIHFLITDINYPQTKILIERATDFALNSNGPFVVVGNIGHSFQRAQKQSEEAVQLFDSFKERGFSTTYVTLWRDRKLPCRLEESCKKTSSIGLNGKRTRAAAEYINPENFINGLLNEFTKVSKWTEYPDLLPGLRELSRRNPHKIIIIPIFCDDYRLVSQAYDENDLNVSCNSIFTPTDSQKTTYLLQGISEPVSSTKIIGRTRISRDEKIDLVFDKLATDAFEEYYRALPYHKNEMSYAEVKGVFFSVLANIETDEKLNLLLMCARYMSQQSKIDKQNFLADHFPQFKRRFFGPTFGIAFMNFLFAYGLFE